MKKVSLFCFMFCLSVVSAAWASITSVDLVGLKEGSVVNLDKSTLFQPVYHRFML